jgi:hypothetical protein
MSKRFSHLWRIMAARRAALALLFAILATGLATGPVIAGNTALRISEPNLAIPGQNALVHITLDNLASVRGFGGIVFLIAYEASALTFQEATPGVLIDSCGWEYFTYRAGSQGNCGGPCPSGLVRLMAIAESNNANVHPSCFFSGTSGTLATLKFLISNDPIYNGVFVPISFYWLDCSDNSFASTNGDTMYFSHRVYDFPSGNDITGQPGYGGWQGILGSPDCLDLQGPPPDTGLDFYNGGVNIAFVDPIDTRGDLNLNGIANEVADLVMFTNYFLSGLSAFASSGNMNAAIAASDVNADGMNLTYQDAVYLDRIVIGDAVPFPKQAVGAGVDAYFQQDAANHKVVVNCDLPLAGAFMLIRGNVTPTFLIPQVGWGIWSTYDGTYTRIVIIGDLNQPYGNGVWFTYQGTGELESVETTDWHDSPITSHISYTTNICGDFDGSGSINIADPVYIIRYIFSGGFPPVDPNAGDVNCDSSCNIADIVYLLAYMFSGGPAPCENCK